MKEKIITEAQLEEALKTQVIFGGRLGTNLVDLGYLDEEALAYFLSKKLGAPYAHPKTLLDIPAEVIKAMPRDVAERYKVLPLEVNRRKMKLVMADPQDYDAINEITFLTGYTIEPMVTPEMRLVQALEVHYNIERSPRYMPFRDDIKEKQEREARGKSANKAAKTEVTPQSSAIADDDEISEEILADKVRKIKERRKSMLSARMRKKPDAPQKSAKALPADKLRDNLNKVEEKEEVGAALLEYVTGRFPLGAILAVRGETAYGWRGAGLRHCERNIHKIRVPLIVPSILTESCENGYVLHDEEHLNPMDKLIRRLLGIKNHLDMAAAPVYYNKTIVCFIMAAGPDEVFGKDARDELKSAAKFASQTFGRLIMKHRKKTM